MCLSFGLLKLSLLAWKYCTVQAWRLEAVMQKSHLTIICSLLVHSENWCHLPAQKGHSAGLFFGFLVPDCTRKKYNLVLKWHRNGMKSSKKIQIKKKL